MNFKKLPIVLVVAVVGVLAVQIGRYAAHYGKANDLMDSMMPLYESLGEDEFRTTLVSEFQEIGIILDPAEVTIVEREDARTAKVRLRYTAHLDLLVVVLDRNVVLRRTARNIDF